MRTIHLIVVFQVGIASKYFGPIILSMNHMMKDVLLFLITFAVIMLAFASGVSYIFNMASGKPEPSFPGIVKKNEMIYSCSALHSKIYAFLFLV